MPKTLKRFAQRRNPLRAVRQHGPKAALQFLFGIEGGEGLAQRTDSAAIPFDCLAQRRRIQKLQQHVQKFAGQAIVLAGQIAVLLAKRRIHRHRSIGKQIVRTAPAHKL